MDKILAALQLSSSQQQGDKSRLFQVAEERLLREYTMLEIEQLLGEALSDTSPDGDESLFRLVLFLDHLLAPTRSNDELVKTIAGFIKGKSECFASLDVANNPHVAKILLRWIDSQLLDMRSDRIKLEAIVKEGERRRAARKAFGEITERDRDRQRAVREQFWQFEGPPEEYVKRARRLSEQDWLCIDAELDHFHSLTNDGRATKKGKAEIVDLKALRPSHTAFLFVLEYFNDLRDDAELYAIVRKLAQSAFFYDDLHELNQVHVDYYSEEDDRRDVRSYNFDSDDLAKRVCGRSHFLLERALRMRKACERFEREQRAVDHLDKDRLRSFYSLINSRHSECLESCRIIDLVSKKLGRVFVAVDLHISLVLSLFALLNPKRLKPQSLYSLNAGKSLEYITKRIYDEHSVDRVLVVSERCKSDVSLSEIKSFFN